MVDNVRVPSDGAGKRITSKVFNDGSNDNYTQIAHIGDRTDPNVLATVTAAGSVFTEFPTGAPIFNAFNRMLVSQDNLLSAYKFYEGAKAVSAKIDETTVGSGTVAVDTGNNSYRCRVPSGNGNKATITSHRHFSYKPGASITMYFVVGFSTPAQPDVTRRAGLFNDDDGIFLENQNGTLSLVIRDSLSATENRIPQSAWNGDRLDGLGGDTNRSGATISLENMNIFSITYQYLSAGAVTLGTYVNGVPVVCHTIGHYGALTAPYMATTYLPHRFEVETTGTGQVGDTDLYTWCSASIADGYEDLIRTPCAFEAEASLTDGTETLICSFRPSQTYLGTDNRYRYLLQYLSSFTATEPVVFTLYAGASLTGATFASSTLGLEIDTAATALNSGLAYGKKITSAGNHGNLNLMEAGMDSSTDGLFRKADITETDIWSITARRLSSSGTTDVAVAGAFAEVQ